MWKWLLRTKADLQKKDVASSSVPSSAPSSLNPLDGVRILKHAQAMRVVFFYPGEEGTYVDDCMVTLFENGVVHLRSKSEETTTHLHHCEILWRYENPVEKSKGDGAGKVRVLKFKNREGGNREPEPAPPPPPHPPSTQ